MKLSGTVQCINRKCERPIRFITGAVDSTSPQIKIRCGKCQTMQLITITVNKLEESNATNPTQTPLATNTGGSNANTVSESTGDGQGSSSEKSEEVVEDKDIFAGWSDDGKAVEGNE